MDSVLPKQVGGILSKKLAEIEKQFGIAVQYRFAAYTSQQCSKCGYVDKRNRKTQSQFHCLFCGSRCQADIQAARVLLHGRSMVSPSQNLSRQHILVEATRCFNERYTRPRGGPADPRFTNPYFVSWARAQIKKTTGGEWGEVIRQDGSCQKNARCAGSTTNTQR